LVDDTAEVAEEERYGALRGKVEGLMATSKFKMEIDCIVRPAIPFNSVKTLDTNNRSSMKPWAMMNRKFEAEGRDD